MINDNKTYIIGHCIRKRRKQKEMTQEQLAYVAGCSSQTISKLENGGRITTNILERICAALDINLEQALGI